jgi:subtilisin family serine protease
MFNIRFNEKDPRVKVVAIDTGIEATHLDFQVACHRRSPIKAAKSFYRGDPWTDAVGHGTHIADTLL